MFLPKGSLLQGGRYQIVRFIASGGFGCTYEAFHPMLEVKVAIKEFFPKTLCNRDSDTSNVSVGTLSQKPLVEKLKKKFVNEARAIARLFHPGIVKVTDVFEENGTAYYVMDYIEGKSLNEIINQRGMLSEEESLGYIVQLCDALSYIHSKNRLHLDIKPSNIMVRDGGATVLIDFGASKQYDQENGENTSTLLGQTPGFAPIEQMGNDVNHFRPATDIYAVGATLYKCLTGKTPLHASLLAQGEELEPLPSYVSASTKKAIEAALNISPKNRPQTIEEFLAILQTQETGKESTGTTTVEAKFPKDNSPQTKKLHEEPLKQDGKVSEENSIEESILISPEALRQNQIIEPVVPVEPFVLNESDLEQGKQPEKIALESDKSDKDEKGKGPQSDPLASNILPVENFNPISKAVPLNYSILEEFVDVIEVEQDGTFNQPQTKKNFTEIKPKNPSIAQGKEIRNENLENKVKKTLPENNDSQERALDNKGLDIPPSFILSSFKDKDSKDVKPKDSKDVASKDVEGKDDSNESKPHTPLSSQASQTSNSSKDSLAQENPQLPNTPTSDNKPEGQKPLSKPISWGPIWDIEEDKDNQNNKGQKKSSLTKVIIGIAVVVVLGLGGWFLFGGDKAVSSDPEAAEEGIALATDSIGNDEDSANTTENIDGTNKTATTDAGSGSILEVIIPDNIKVGKEFKIVFKLSSKRYSNFKVADIEGLEKISGPDMKKSKKCFEFSFTYKADKAGEYTIPTATVKVRDKMYFSKSQKLTIQ